MTATIDPINQLYAHLSEEARQELASHEKRLKVSGGSSLVRYGVPSDHLVILNSGSAEIYVPTGSKALSLGMAGPGRVLGLQSVLSGEAPPTSVICRELCDITLIPKDAFLDVLRKHPQIYFSIARILSSELSTADHAIRTHRRSSKVKARVGPMKALQVV